MLRPSNSEHQYTPIERAERWAVMEWILVGGRRWWLLLLLIAMIAVSTALVILYADSVSRLRPNELRTLIRRDEELPEARGPLFRRVRERGSEE
jgi:hypothetical protein